MANETMHTKTSIHVELDLKIDDALLSGNIPDAQEIKSVVQRYTPVENVENVKVEVIDKIRPSEKVDWTPVRERLKSTRYVEYDGCHKIYLEADGSIRHHNSLRYAIDMNRTRPENALATIQKWYDESDDLRFVNYIGNADGNMSYEQLIEQQ